MLNLKSGSPLATIKNGKFKGEILYLNDDDEDVDAIGSQEINLKKAKLSPLLNIDRRAVCYVAGPSGSGKTTYSVELAKNYQKIFPKVKIYLFSRTDYKLDPAYEGMKLQQIMLDQSLVQQPIVIEEEVDPGSLILFDDCGTITDTEIRKAVNHLMMDIMEVGRKLNINCIITSHLISGTDRNLARTILNEMTTFTFFCKSGSIYQIKYTLKNYLGMNPKQIQRILDLPSRWVTVLKNYPQCILYQHGAYLP